MIWIVSMTPSLWFSFLLCFVFYTTAGMDIIASKIPSLEKDINSTISI
jgi:hypothetical protein